MEYIYLLIAGILVSIVHIYLVWSNRKSDKRSISEYAILDKKSWALYFVAHVVCDVLILVYAYTFFVIGHSLIIPFSLLVVFAVLDLVQAAFPSQKKTEKIHLVAAYVSWICFMLAGLVALIQLEISTPYNIIAWLLLLPVFGMFIYMHINRTKLYPYQLLMVPLYVACMVIATIGAR